MQQRKYHHIKNTFFTSKMKVSKICITDIIYEHSRPSLEIKYVCIKTQLEFQKIVYNIR